MRARDDTTDAVLRLIRHRVAARAPVKGDISGDIDARFVVDRVPLEGRLVPRVEPEQPWRLLRHAPHHMRVTALAQLREQHGGGHAVDEPRRVLCCRAGPREHAAGRHEDARAIGLVDPCLDQVERLLVGGEGPGAAICGQDAVPGEQRDIDRIGHRPGQIAVHVVGGNVMIDPDVHRMLRPGRREQRQQPEENPSQTGHDASSLPTAPIDDKAA